jgi:hypothetical protein
MSEYNCDSCGVPDELCNRHNECVAEVWHTALKLAEGQKPPTNSVRNAIAALTQQLGLPPNERDWNVVFDVRNKLQQQHP